MDCTAANAEVAVVVATGPCDEFLIDFAVALDLPLAQSVKADFRGNQKKHDLTDKRFYGLAPTNDRAGENLGRMSLQVGK